MTLLKKLNTKTGRYYRLPTEAEWEYAARGGIHAIDHYTYSGSNDANTVAWYDSNSDKNTHIISTKGPNQLGVYDMSGNVQEWCWDWYGKYDNGSQTNPKGPLFGYNRIVRGGAWCYDVSRCRNTFRSFNSPSIRSSILGFRLVRNQ